jgi:hypothetical protein
MEIDALESGHLSSVTGFCTHCFEKILNAVDPRIVVVFIQESDSSVTQHQFRIEYFGEGGESTREVIQQAVIKRNIVVLVVRVEIDPKF